ncbi:MAG: hypothetical protein JNL94_14945 [Planctomycetes bacterium]|nr:hypothetical protein [Planctomycetota bacterium]
MASVHNIPAPDAVARLFNDLLGRRVVAKKSAVKQAVTPRSPGAFGLYGPGDDQIDGIVFCDVALACYSGAALSLIPAATVQQSVRAGKMADGTFENFSEVLNIARGWFDTPGQPPVKLRRCVPAPCDLPKELIALLLKPAERLDLDIEIDGYGAGKMLLVVK